MENNELAQLCWDGNTRMIKQILRDNPTLHIPIRIFEAACARGHLEAAKLLKPPEIHGSVLCLACENGQLEVAQWIYQISGLSEYTAIHAVKAACQKGHAEVVQWLLYVNPQLDNSPDTEFAYRRACYTDNFKVCQWINQESYPFRSDIYVDYDDAFIYYCGSGDLIGAQTLLQKHPYICYFAYGFLAFKLACKNGHLAVCRWILTIDTTFATLNASFGKFIRGHIKDSLKMIGGMHNYKTSTHDMAMAYEYSVENGHIEVAKWLLSLDSTLNSYNCSDCFAEVCRNGHLEMAKWLVESDNSCEDFIELALLHATENGHLPVVQWILETNPTLDTREAIIESVRWRKWDIFTYFMESGRIYRDMIESDRSPYERDYIFRFVCGSGDIALVKQMYMIHPNVKHLAVSAFLNSSHDEVARWLYQTFPEMIYNHISDKNEKMFQNACSNNNIQLATWLLEIKPSIDITANHGNAFRLACCNGHIEISRWLYSLRPYQFQLQITDNTIVEYSYSPNIDYVAIREKMNLVQLGADMSLKEALIRDRFHPRNMDKWIGWGQQDDYFE